MVQYKNITVKLIYKSRYPHIRGQEINGKEIAL